MKITDIIGAYCLTSLAFSGLWALAGCWLAWRNRHADTSGI